MLKANQAYMQTQVTTTNQGEVVVMLYDGAIKFLNRSKDLMEKKDFAGKGNMISRALDIINELDSSLNLEKGGEIAKNLHSLYFFCNSRLLMANLKASPMIVDEVIKILSGLRDAYAQILSNPEAQAAAVKAAASLPAEATRTQIGRATPGPQNAASFSNARGASLYAKGNRAFGGTPVQQQAASPAAAVDPGQQSQAAVQAVESAAVHAPAEQPAPRSTLDVEPPAGETPNFAAARMAKAAIYRKLSTSAQQ